MSFKEFEYKSPNFGKLTDFGFVKKSDAYVYVTTILDGQFEMNVDISAQNGKVTTKLIDTSTEEIYTLHLVAEASGAYVGAVRAEYERVLNEIADECFEKDVFKSRYAHKVIEYVRQKYGDDPEYLWKPFPSNAVLRRKDSNKWYGILLILSKRKLGLDSDEIVDMIDLRIDPSTVADTVDGKKYFAGYHMNKKSWFTMILDGSVPVEEIYDWIDKSYNLAKVKK